MAAASSFTQPLRHIYDASDLAQFERSPTHDDLLKFIAAMNAAAVDKPLSFDCPIAPATTAIVGILSELANWVDEIPPLQQPMRYGNKAFRAWQARLLKEAPRLCSSLLTDATAGAHVELTAYFCDAFGNSTRIDYGTGHETCFIIFLYCVAKLGLLTAADLPAMVLRLFPAYLSVCRKLQRSYWLEPAGSHGVWSLDDYQFLAFLFGSAQLLNHKHIKPRSIHSGDIIEGYSKDYMYLESIRFINAVKQGAPFAEHSPILNDIAELPSWGKVNEGLAKMYKAEVLGKLPVIQHLVFGSLFPSTWTASRPPAPSETSVHLFATSHGVSKATEAADAAAAASEQVPVDHAAAAVAPWATEPPMAAHLHSHAQAQAAGGAGMPRAGSSGSSADAMRPPLELTGVAPWAAAAAASAGASVTGLGSGPSHHTPGSAFHEAFGPIKHIHAAKVSSPASSPRATASPGAADSSAGGDGGSGSGGSGSS